MADGMGRLLPLMVILTNEQIIAFNDVINRSRGGKIGSLSD